MKKIMITSVTLLLTLCLFSQNEIAYVDVSFDVKNLTYTTSKKTIANFNYVNAVYNQDLSIQIKTFQKMVADYDITEQPCYNLDKKCTYDVVFRDDNNTITATYDKEGAVLKSFEKYEAIKLPYKISAKIVKENPGWNYESIKCVITYEEGKSTSTIYQIKLRKEKSTKTIKIQS